MTDWLTCVVSSTFCMKRVKAGETENWSLAVAELLCGEKEGCCEAETRLRFEGDAEELEMVENQR